VEISAGSCVPLECDSRVDFRVLWVSSDEGADDDGDGAPDRDIMIECDRVRLSAQRNDGGNGRVYRVAVRATDVYGNSTDGSCTVRVPIGIDEPALEDTPYYRIEANGCIDRPIAAYR
jgi:hypothetical protein